MKSCYKSGEKNLRWGLIVRDIRTAVSPGPTVIRTQTEAASQNGLDFSRIYLQTNPLRSSMAAFQTGDIAAFQTIEVSSDENGAFVLAAEEDDRRGEAEMARVLGNLREKVGFRKHEMGGFKKSTGTSHRGLAAPVASVWHMLTGPKDKTL